MSSKTKMKNKKYLLTSLLALIVTAGFSYHFVNGGDFKVNVLGAINNYVFGVDENTPDIGISNIYATKIDEPKKDFPYYKYRATVTLRNYGATYQDSSLILNAGENQKTAFVRNSVDGFTLAKGEIFTFDDYEFLMDAKANYAELTFKLESKNNIDGDSNNNSYTLAVFELPASLGTLSVKDFDGKNLTVESAYNLDFSEHLGNLTKEICSLKVDDTEGLGDLRYAETDTSNDVFSYYKLKISKDLLMNEDLNCEKSFEIESTEEFELFYDDDRVYFLMARIDDNSFALSNAISLPKQEFIDKQSFAKLFVELAEVPQITANSYYLDVPLNSEYSTYVQAMYDNGLTSESMQLEDKTFSFYPEKVVTRADVLEPLLNYFDVDLIEGDGAPHFSDIDNLSKIYYFVEALYADGKGRSFSQKFSPEKRASTEFVKYLINEFKDA